MKKPEISQIVEFTAWALVLGAIFVGLLLSAADYF